MSLGSLEGRLGDVVAEHSRRHDLSPDLVRAVIRVESGWNPRAVSAKGALGLMQLMPSTAAEYGVSDPFDPEQNIRAGVAYLRKLIDRFDGKTELALAAYNAGPGAVEKYGRTIPPYKETQSYVRRIVSVTEVRIGPRKRIFKIVELIDGREVPRYSDKKPVGTYGGDEPVVDLPRAGHRAVTDRCRRGRPSSRQGALARLIQQFGTDPISALTASGQYLRPASFAIAMRAVSAFRAT